MPDLTVGVPQCRRRKAGSLDDSGCADATGLVGEIDEVANSESAIDDDGDPATRSFTIVWAPRLTARPRIPALTIRGVTLMPSTSSTMTPAMNHAMKRSRLTSSRSIDALRCSSLSRSAASSALPGCGTRLGRVTTSARIVRFPRRTTIQPSARIRAILSGFSISHIVTSAAVCEPVAS